MTAILRPRDAGVPAALQRSFTVNATVSAAHETLYSAEGLAVTRVDMAENDRPDTQFDTQKSHAVAWTLEIGKWREAFTGTLPRVFANLRRMAGQDEANDTNDESVQLRTFAIHELNVTTPLPLSEWNARLNRAIGFYVEAYQKSSFTTHNTKAKGRGEGHAKEKLRLWNAAAIEDGTPGITQKQIVEAARKLLDANYKVEPDVLCKAYDEWIRAISDNYEALGDDFARAILAEVAAKPLSPGWKKTFNMNTLGELLQAWKMSPQGNEATVAVPSATVPTQSKFVVNAVVVADDATKYPLDAVHVDAVQLSEGDRPPTQFGDRQLSHSVAWTGKIQQWQTEYRGPLRQVLTNIVAAGARDHAVDTNPTSRNARQQLGVIESYLQDAALPHYPLSLWRGLFTQALTTYVNAYQQSSTTTHGATPASRGEGAAKEWLSQYETQIKGGGLAGVATAGENSEAIRHALMLLDAPAHESRDLFCKAHDDWLTMLKVNYPGVMGRSDAAFTGYLATPVAPHLSAPGVTTIGGLLQAWRLGLHVTELGLPGSH